MLAIGEVPMDFGLHSLRIGGATVVFAAGATPIIKNYGQMVFFFGWGRAWE